VKRPEILVGTIIIVNACLWGFTLLMVSHTLRGTGAYQQIQNILGGAAGASLVIVGGGMAGLLASLKAKERPPDDNEASV
jgi:NADPH-dependent 2,4-dienoyl-CoA reductase/sulfur reductase-like enzyme